MPLPEGKQVFGDGGAAIIEPAFGEVIAGRWFDVVGHYGREDVLVRGLAVPGAGRTERERAASVEEPAAGPDGAPDSG